MDRLEGIRGLLLDVDGTLIVHDRAVPGAREALARIRDRGLRCRITTNTTRRPRQAVAEALGRAGLEIRPEEILSPAVLARKRILVSGRTRAALMVPEATRADFAGVVIDEDRPDWLVVGDLGAGFTWERLNAAFLHLRQGASLLALHENRFWSPGPGPPVLDAGPFVAALAYAAGITAEVVGKPSADFFQLALDEMGLSPHEVLVVGDDPETDGAGGRRAGCRTAIVRTGKGASLASTPFAPDLVLDSVADLLVPWT